METEHLTQEIALVTHIPPAAARASGSYVGAAVDAKLFNRLMAYLHVGTLSGAATATLKFQHNSVSASSDAGWADVNSACATSAFASASNDKVGQLELRLDQYPALSQYIRPYVAVATSSWLGAVQVLGKPAYKPATGYDSADVVQTVVY